MNPKRKSRIYLAVFLLVAVSGTTAALMLALEQNINMFYPPAEVVDGTRAHGSHHSRWGYGKGGLGRAG